MASDPTRDQRDRAVALLCTHPDFSTESGRLALRSAAFAARPGAESLLDLDLSGNPRQVAERLVDRLCAFGCLDARHALGLLLDRIADCLGDDRRPAVEGLIRDLDLRCTRPGRDEDCPYLGLSVMDVSDSASWAALPKLGGVTATQDVTTGSDAVPVGSHPTGNDEVPFPGLRPFTSKQARFYCGREQEIDDLVHKLGPLRQSFIMLIGASGSGKSSLVAAGLVPRLESEAVDGSREWIRLRFRPGDFGDNPFMALAAQIHPYLGSEDESPRQIAARIVNEPDTFVQLCDQILVGRESRSELFLFIDQLEEVFTLANASYLGPFLDWLCTTARIPRVRIVAALRADFYHLCIARAPLAVLLRQAHYSLAPPDLVALDRMIALPAQRAGLELEKGLAKRLRDDAGAKSGSLALLAFALAEIYRVRSGNLLTHAAYEDLGEIKGIIAGRAESALETLSEEDRHSLDRLFNRLVGIDERGGVMRQAAPKRLLVATVPAAKQLFDVLIDKARLLVANERPDGEPIIEIAHESLFETWDRLEKWVEDRKDDLILLRQMKNAADEWDKHRRADPYLWPHERLEPLRCVIRKLGPELTDLSPMHIAFMCAETDRLLAEIESSSISHYRRAFIGNRLAQIGDTRRGVGFEPSGCNILWCLVPPGKVRLRPTGREFVVDAFRIAKYPVTWAQYESFMTTHPVVAKIERPAGHGHNYPVVGISWLDAVRFCGWLSTQCAFDVRLPTEWEWQLAAAGGSHESDYPWGSECDLERANTFESRLRQPTAVGMYPHGASPVGAMDMAGNVWEWCSNTYDNLELAEGKHLTPTDRVVIRGGSWRNNLTVARTWYRNHADPSRGQDCVGLRLVASRGS